MEEALRNKIAQTDNLKNAVGVRLAHFGRLHVLCRPSSKFVFSSQANYPAPALYKSQLETAIYDLGQEFEACTGLRGSLEERMSTVQNKMQLNRSRLQVGKCIKKRRPAYMPTCCVCPRYNGISYQLLGLRLLIQSPAFRFATKGLTASERWMTLRSSSLTSSSSSAPL